MNQITVLPYLRKYKEKRYNNSEKIILKYFEDYYQENAILLHSGRVGLYSGLEHYNFSSARENHILVPKYISSCVLNILNKNSFPVRKLDGETKAVLILHQWGYPQKMDQVLPLAREKKLIVIEDCANSFNSKYNGKLIGTFGDFSIFSFPKIFSSFTGGMVISKNKQLIEAINHYKKSKDQLLANIFQKISFKVLKNNSLNNRNFLNHDLHSIFYSKYASLVKIDSWALRLLPPSKEVFEKLLNKRKENLNYIKKNIPPWLYKNDIESDSDVYPFAVPLFANDVVLEKIKNNLVQKNILADILHFDVNRNIFDPNYQKCIALPCHHILDKESLRTMVETINQAIL